MHAYFPYSDENFEEAGYSEDRIELLLLLPRGRKSRAKKKKSRVWYDENRLMAEENISLKMYFIDIYQFRLDLENTHILQIRKFMYH